MVEAMGKSDEVVDMSLEMCNDNGGQPYIYIYSEELAGRTGGKNWREEKWREKWRVDIMSCGVYLVPDGVTNRD